MKLSIEQQKKAEKMRLARERRAAKVLLLTDEDRAKSAAAMDKARSGKLEKLGTQSPVARGHEKTKLVLDWVYRWGWASPSVIEKIGGAKRSGLAARLVKNGLLISTRSESGGAIRGVPNYFLTLSRLGLGEVEAFRQNLLPYDLDPFKIRQDQLRHFQIAQEITLKSLANNSISGYETERENFKKSALGVKQPDIVWISEKGRWAVEVELSAKWDRTLDQFVRSSLRSIRPEKEESDDLPPDFNLILLVSDSPAILKRYKAAFSAGQSLQLWQKIDGRWKTANTINVPTWVDGKIQCKLFAE